MKSSIKTWLLSPFKSEACNRSAHDVAEAAESELSAFYHAVRIHKGTEAAQTAADNWLRLFGSARIDRDNLQASFRKVTIAAAALLSAEVDQQTSQPPRSCTPCRATSI